MRAVAVAPAALSVLLVFLFVLAPVSADGPSVAIDTPTASAVLVGNVVMAGTASDGSGITHVHVRVDAGSYVVVDSMTGDTAVAWEHVLDSSAFPNGVHTLEARARTSGGDFVSAFVDVTFDNPVVLDLVAAGLVAEGALGAPTLTVAVENPGSGAVTGAVARFEYRYQDEWFHVADVLFDVAADGGTSVSADWDTRLKLGTFPVRVTLDPDNAIGEADESNNVAEASAVFYAAPAPTTDLLWPLESDPQPWQTKIIRIEGDGPDSLYLQAVMPVRVGDWVAWVNEDLNEALHTATADDGSFDTEAIEGGTYSIVAYFDTPGTYGYHCVYHPDMTGTIWVVAG